MILVISVLAIVGIMATVLLSLSFMNYRMKQVNLKSKDNFYDAETVLDEIRTGLSMDVSDAVGNAYQYMLTKYDETPFADRNRKYKEQYVNLLVDKLADPADVTKSKYQIDHLRQMVTENAIAGKNDSLGKDDIVSVSAGKNPELVCDSTNGTVTLRNVHVRYSDKRNFTTVVDTDIVLNCPALDFEQKTMVPDDLLAYILVANDQTECSGVTSVQVNGNAYLGYDGADFNAATASFGQPAGATSSKIILGNGSDPFRIRQLSDVTLKGNVQLWAHDIEVDSSKFTVEDGAAKTFVSDDIVLKNAPLGTVTSPAAKVYLNGKLYAYGQLDSAKASKVYTEGKDADGKGNTFQSVCDNSPASCSSSILLNCKSATVDLSGLKQMMIAGNAYVGAEEKNGGEIANKNDVQMGESVALKSDQRAYLVPANYIAGDFDDCGGHGKNPMLAGEYEELKDRIAQKKHVSTDALTAKDFIRDGSGDFPQEWADEHHVTGIQMAIYPLKIGEYSENVIYFFLQFDSLKSAMKYGMAQPSMKDSVVSGRIDMSHYDSSVSYPSGATADTPNDFMFFYNGSVLMADPSGTGNAKFIKGKCTKADGSLGNQLKYTQMAFQEQYSALRHKLLNNYGYLKDDEKGQRVYQNLVKDFDFSGIKEFTLDATGEKALLVKEDDFEWKPGCVSDSDKVHLIIASGNVKVSADFEGLIIAGKNITIAASGCELKANRNLVEKIIANARSADGKRPADYLKDGEAYLPEKEGDGSEENNLNYTRLVTYSNWTKE